MQNLFYLTNEQRAIRDLARDIARERIAPRAAHVDETGEYPREQLAALAKQGLMGLHIPEQYGGSAAGALAFCLAAEEVAWACASTSTIFLVQNLGGYPILFAGTDEQKRRYLQRSPPRFHSQSPARAPTPPPSPARPCARVIGTSSTDRRCG